MEPVEEYQILFNITSGREDFFTENEAEYEDMMDELTREGKLDDISQCVKKTYIWDDEIEQYVEDDVEILYDNILEETKKKTESKNKKEEDLSVEEENKLAGEIEKYLTDNQIYPADVSASDTRIMVELHWEDWKHGHLRSNRRRWK